MIYAHPIVSHRGLMLDLLVREESLAEIALTIWDCITEDLLSACGRRFCTRRAWNVRRT